MIGILIGLLFLSISLIFRGCITLLLRFDILNAILISGLFQLLTTETKWSNELRWLAFVFGFVIILELQRRYKIMRLMMGGVSTVLSIAVGYGWTSYDSKWKQILVILGCLVLSVGLNYFSSVRNIRK